MPTQKSEFFRRLEECRKFNGPVKEFWPFFLQTLVELAGAEHGLLITRGTGATDWRAFCQCPSNAKYAMPLSIRSPEFDTLTATARAQGVDYFKGNPDVPKSTVVLHLDIEEENQECLAVLHLPTIAGAELEDICSKLQMARDTVALYQRQRNLNQAKHDVAHFSQTMDIMAMLNEKTRYLAAAMTLVNEAAARFHCSRVSLGYFQKPYIRMQAISNMEKFERKMEVVQQLEAAMEEAFDQNDEIVYPVVGEVGYIYRDHEAFCTLQGVRNIVSLPIRLNGERWGVLTLERADQPFTETELMGLRVLCDQAARRLSDLKEHDRWIGARATTGTRKKLAKLVGHENTWAKIFALLGLIALLALVFVEVPYRVEGDFIVRSDELSHLPAPYEGYLEEVPFRVGDQVSQGAVLVRLDTAQLLLDQSAAEAEIQRHISEAEKAEAENSLAEMRVAQAQAMQAQAKLDLILHRLAQAEVRAPFDGVIVVGDLRDRIGAPVKAGEILMRLTRLEDLYLEVKVPERDIHEIDEQQGGGEFAFVSRPSLKFDFDIARIEPVAIADGDGNFFILRGEPIAEPAAWWRPGMSGVAKIDIEDRSLLWIGTHRLLDFLRMKLWW